MCNYYYCFSVIPRHFEKQFQHKNTGFGVKRACRFVAKQNFWVFCKCTRNRDPLLFTAREFGREVLQVVGKSDFFNHFCCGERVRCDLFYQRNVFVNGQCRNEVVKLKNKSDFCRSVIRKFVFGQGGYILSLDIYFSACRAVKSAEKIQQRAFARAARSENNNELALFKRHIHSVKRFQLVVSARVNTADIFEFHNSHKNSP